MDVTYLRADVEVQFRDMIMGGVPKSADVAEDWANIKGLTDDQKKQLEAEGIDPDETVERMSTGFYTDDIGIYVVDITWKAHIKDMLKRLGIFVKKSGSKNEVIFGLQIRPERVRFYRDDQIIKVVDGKDSSIAHITTPQGRRSAFCITEYLKQPICKFSCYLLQPATKFSIKSLGEAFLAGQEFGFNAKRTMGHGRYDVIKFDEKGDIKVKLGDKLN